MPYQSCRSCYHGTGSRSSYSRADPAGVIIASVADHAEDLVRWTAYKGDRDDSSGRRADLGARIDARSLFLTNAAPR